MSQLTVDELQHAEFQLIRYLQAREFSFVISSLSRNALLKNFSLSRPISKLNPVLVEGILRVGGRLEKAPIDYNARHPIMLPNSSHFTNLLILHHHNLVGHSGMGTLGHLYVYIIGLSKVAPPFDVSLANASSVKNEMFQ